jgi:transposase
MMGAPVGRQDRLFYEFCLEDVVPAGHLLRKIDAVLDLSWLRGEIAAHYSDIGRPSICPELMIRMLLVGYCFSIRSERRLCQEVELNLAYRWFCRLGLEDRIPDHSTFSVNRHGRFRASDVLRKVFEEVVCGCMTAGLVAQCKYAEAELLYKRALDLDSFVAWRRVPSDFFNSLSQTRKFCTRDLKSLNGRGRPGERGVGAWCAACRPRGHREETWGV